MTVRARGPVSRRSTTRTTPAAARRCGGDRYMQIAHLEERLAGAERARKAEVLAREVVVIADLRMALVEARRPFWRRWLLG